MHKWRTQGSVTHDIAYATLTCGTCVKYYNAFISGLEGVKARGDATLILHVGKKDEIEIVDNDWVVPGHTVFV